MLTCSVNRFSLEASLQKCWCIFRANHFYFSLVVGLLPAGMLIRRRRSPAQGSVMTFSVVIGHCSDAVAFELTVAGRCPGNQIFVLDYSVYTFGKGIIGGFSPHTDADRLGSQQLQIPPIGILATPVGVMNQAGQFLTANPCQGHLQGPQVGFGPQVLAARPADDPARVDVKDE